MLNYWRRRERHTQTLLKKRRGISPQDAAPLKVSVNLRRATLCLPHLGRDKRVAATSQNIRGMARRAGAHAAAPRGPGSPTEHHQAPIDATAHRRQDRNRRAREGYLQPYTRLSPAVPFRFRFRLRTRQARARRRCITARERPRLSRLSTPVVIIIP